jgi:hypothetical protein
MWDNRGRKTNPRAPDFRCKDKANCDGAIWESDKQQATQSTQATQQRVAQRVQQPPPPERDEWEEQEEDRLPF